LEEDSRITNNNNNNSAPAIRLGLGPNISQFLVLVLVNAFVGAMVGLEQTVVLLIGKNEFGIESNALIVSFIASFGAVKAVLNLFAGSMSDKWGRKNILVLGWLFGISVPFILLFAPDWSWIIFCKCIAWDKPRTNLVNDYKYENRLSMKTEKRTSFRIK